MCGNGIRVFVRYLMQAGLIRLEDGGDLAVGTRAGTKRVRRVGELLAVDLGPWRITGGPAAAEAGFDATVELPGDPVALPGLSVNVGNPHVVVALPDARRLAAVDLHRAPLVDPRPAGGTNVELVVPEHGASGGRLRMRVHERGVGETRSCGTGAAAAVLASRVWGGPAAPDSWRVQVPGGVLQVEALAGEVVAGGSVWLAGPAEIVGEGRLDAGWLSRHTPAPAAG